MKTPSEHERLKAILAAVRDLQEHPAYTVGQICEVTGLSRSRVDVLVLGGKFTVVTRNGGKLILLASVEQYYAGRMAVHTATGGRSSNHKGKS